ncbi:MAG TPA: DUF86 domain-containing protein [Balneolaceae bacterium]|nr:DUF86 domain-containing protein [Balneolaceae bacterium]
MDQRVIDEKLESLRRCIKRVETKRPGSPSELEEDIDLQDILSVNLERAIQQCVDIGAHIIASSEEEAPNTMADTFQKLLDMHVLTKETAKVMKKAVGFRNIAVHNYEQINWNIVFNICTQQLDDFKEFAREITKYLTTT